MKMIRENEPRAISLGYHVDRYKLLAFVLLAALAGLAGALKTVVMGFAMLTDESVQNGSLQSHDQLKNQPFT